MKISIVQVPYDSGHRGVRMGAGPLRLAGPISTALEAAGHEVRVRPVEAGAAFATEAGSAFELAAGIRDEVAAARAGEWFPLVLAGNCIASVGTVAGAASSSVVWFDAHADLNTPETTESGFLDGMAISVLLGRCWRTMAGRIGLPEIREDAMWLVGARDLDPAEAQYLERAAVHQIAADSVRAGRMPSPRNDVYVHVDLDVLDPSAGKANCFATPGGLSVEDVLSAIEASAAAGRLTAAAMTAYDPAFDARDDVLRAAVRIALHLSRNAVAGE